MWNRNKGDENMKYQVEWYVKPETLESILNSYDEKGYKVMRIDTYHQNDDRGSFLYYCVVFVKEEKEELLCSK